MEVVVLAASFWFSVWAEHPMFCSPKDDPVWKWDFDPFAGEPYYDSDLDGSY